MGHSQVWPKNSQHLKRHAFITRKFPRLQLSSFALDQKTECWSCRDLLVTSIFVTSNMFHSWHTPSPPLSLPHSAHCLPSQCQLSGARATLSCSSCRFLWWPSCVPWCIRVCNSRKSTVSLEHKCQQCSSLLGLGPEFLVNIGQKSPLLQGKANGCQLKSQCWLVRHFTDAPSLVWHPNPSGRAECSADTLHDLFFLLPGSTRSGCLLV